MIYEIKVLVALLLGTFPFFQENVLLKSKTFETLEQVKAFNLIYVALHCTYSKI